MTSEFDCFGPGF